MEGVKILVVDDEKHIGLLLREFLEDKGFEVEIAMNGEETLKKISTFKPHLTLLDIRLPDTTGIDLLKKIKQISPETEVIMVTGVLDSEIGKDALNLGAADYITKPIDLNYLYTSVLAKAISILPDLDE